MPSAGEFDEFHLEHYHVGQSYTVPARLASLLIIAGCAELGVVSPPMNSEIPTMPSFPTPAVSADAPDSVT